MGRGHGAPEHNEDTRVAAIDDPKAILDNKRRITADNLDESDDEVEETLIEKAIEQITQEEEVAWQTFHYPWWAQYAVYIIFSCCLVNVILTLTQYHGTHSSRVPVDYIPKSLITGGWDRDEERYGACVLGLIASSFSFVLAPSSGKFKFMFLIMFISSLLHFISFAYDLYDLNKALAIPYCEDAALGMKSQKFYCSYARFQATVIFDMICAVFTFFVAAFILYQAASGIVSRRRVFNEQTKNWEPIVLGPDDDYWMAFPKSFKRQRPLFNFCVSLCAALNITLLTLTITQNSLDIHQADNMPTPIFNAQRTIPVDVYVIETMEAIPTVVGNGGWPLTNYHVRLFGNLCGLITLAFLIQWRQDVRGQQTKVLALLFCSAAVYLAALFLDLDILFETMSGCSYAAPLNMDCSYLRYNVLVVFDGLCGFGTFMFASVGTFEMVSQARSANGKYGRKYGWWCLGEWEHEKQKELEERQLIPTAAATPEEEA